jgi:hypothetical protein
LLPQPAFATFFGGAFHIGDVMRATLLSLDRWAWRVTAEHDLFSVLLIAVACHYAVKGIMMLIARSRWSRSPEVSAMSMFQWITWGTITSVLVTRFRADALNYVTAGGDPTVFLAKSVPQQLFMSRHELTLLNLFAPSAVPLGCIVVGDFLAANPGLPPKVGAIGAVILGVGLYGAGIQPAYGYWLSTGAWIVSAVTYHAAQMLRVNLRSTHVRTALTDVVYTELRASRRPTVWCRVGSLRLTLDSCLWLGTIAAVAWWWAHQTMDTSVLGYTARSAYKVAQPYVYQALPMPEIEYQMALFESEVRLFVADLLDTLSQPHFVIGISSVVTTLLVLIVYLSAY